MKNLLIGRIGLLVCGIFSMHAQADVLVAKGATWSYLDNGSNQNTAWRANTFNDSAWRIGAAQLGYGDADEATVVSYGTNANNRHITTYFRRHFNVSNPSAFANLTLNVLRDDGAVIYLNGVEVRRENMPVGTIAHTTLTANTASETAYYASTIPASSLKIGDNVIAVEVHQTDVTSSDISFDLELIANPAPNAPSVSRGPYLQLATPTAITLRWRTTLPTNSRVSYGTTQGSLNLKQDDITSTTEHEIRLTGLLPNTRYWYSVGSTSASLAGGDTTSYFITPPVTGSTQPTRIWVIGDAGQGTSNQIAVYNAYTKFTGSTDTNLWLMLGDNAYNTGTDAEYQTKFFNIYSPLLKQVTAWPTIGNHDAASADSATQSGPYYTIFNLPRNAEAGGIASGTEAYYSFDYGNIHFVVLDSQESNRTPTGAMMQWLLADLRAYDTANTDWLIAFWHHPPYSKGSHDSDTEGPMIEMRQNFLPVLEEHGVDLVLTGHSHSYERSKFIDGHYGLASSFNNSTHVVQTGSGRRTETGVYNKAAGPVRHAGAIYAVAGSSGTTGGGLLNHPAMFVSLNELGSMVLDIDGLNLNAQFLNNLGTVRDSFTINKGVTPPPVGNITLDLQNGFNGYNAMVDSYVASGVPTTNYGTAPTLLADGSDGVNGRLISVLRWDNLPIPSTAQINSASLSFTFTNGSAGNYGIYALNKAWNESTTTWNTLLPTTNVGTLIGTLPAGTTGTRQITLNAAGKALVQGWSSGTVANNGLLIIDENATDGIDFYSSEYTSATLRPKLTINYTQ